MSTPIIKLTRGVPAVESFPTAQLMECAQAVLAEHGEVVLQYGSARGFPPLRQAIAMQAGVTEDQVIIGQGSLQIQDFCARSMIDPGSLVYVEEPSYDRAITILRRAGARLVGFPLQDDGPDVEMMEARLRGGEKPVLLYIIPDFQNPSGTVMSLEKRQRIAELARRYEFWVIEDVPYRKLRYRGQELPALFELAPDRVLQMSSFSKLVSPGLRVGYVVAPRQCVDTLARAAEDTYINASYFNQAIVYKFIQNGWLEPNIEKLKALYRPRLDAMLAALDEHMQGLATWRRPEGGFFIGMTLRPGASAGGRGVSVDALLANARKAGLELTDGRGFYVGGGGQEFVRLPFCALSEQDIRSGIARLAAVVRQVMG
jgi:DNA-binding transcriptional MocR family regulator